MKEFIEKHDETKLLSLNLQFFADGEGGSEGEDGKSSDGTENTEGKADESKNEHMIPKSRFDEVNNGFKAMKAELDAIKAANEAAEKERQAKEQEAAEKKGEFEGLYNKTKNEAEALKAAKKESESRIQALEGVIEGLLNAKLETIDKTYHDLIPEGMTPEQKLAWVSNAEAKGLFGTKTANTPMGKATNPKGGVEQDVEMNPLQRIMSGYSSRK